MIARKEEIRRMKEAMYSNKAEFIAVTGRRRVGKTYLIDQVFRDYYCFSMTGIQKGGMKTQLVNFGIKLAEYSGTDPVTPPNWQKAMHALKTYLKTLDSTRPQVIFIDELPWVATARSRFIQMLAHLWNDYLSKEPHFCLVICGSATSWIIKNVENDKGGLHNRITENIHLLPFTLPETQDFLQNKGIRLSLQEATRIYMALGGIPFYLEKIQKGESFAVAIERLCFTSKGPLRTEYKNLYKALFKRSHLHEAIVAQLATHPKGLSNAQILQKLKMKKATGTYSRTIKELLDSDFIEDTAPFRKKKRGAIFRLIDEYSIFYHRFIKPNPRYSKGIWQRIAQSQPYKVWAGYAFEALCQKHIEQVKAALGISGVFTQISSLQVPTTEGQKGFQIDLLIDRKDATINLCEIKFHDGPFTIPKSYYQELIRKRQQFIEHTKTRKQVFLTFITNYGVVKNGYALEVVDAEIELEELFT